jgi:hypothetical protein
MLFPQTIGGAEGLIPDSAEIPAPVSTTTLGFSIVSGSPYLRRRKSADADGLVTALIAAKSA